MAGSSAITLYRTEDASIAMQFQARQAARTLTADLSAGTLRLLIKPYPSETPVLTITPDAAVLGCELAIVQADEGRAALMIPQAFWTANPQRRFSVEAFLDSDAATQRLGEQIIDVTE